MATVSRESTGQRYRFYELEPSDQSDEMTVRSADEDTSLRSTEKEKVYGPGTLRCR